ncbi:MAG TPA: DNA polymerase/3'-5' exonuclease PolX [Candidatus Paceibacterota bacterium]|nr:DNA polymerase/3'-5' exonuclease PolX [Candidatus Paceibacterota bacterium]
MRYTEFMHDASNQDIAEILREIATYLEMQDVPFKPRAFEKVAQTIEGLEEEVSALYKKGGLKALEEIPGVGKGIAERIEEFLKTGRIKDHETLKRQVPVKLADFAGIEGVGPKTIKRLYKELGVKDRATLERAVKAGHIAKLAGFGKKSEEKIAKSLTFANGNRRFILGYAMPQIRRVQARLEEVPGAEKVVIAGSARRKKETIGDADILAVAKNSKAIMEKFVSMPEVAAVIAHGDTKSSVKLRSGLNVDLRVVPAESYGAALNYFTGSKDHNVALRKISVAKGWKLNEYGLFRGAKRLAGKNEEELYKAFGMDYIEPELRENTGELEAARKHALPKLIEYGALMGDLQTQTDWTDGTEPIEAMALAAAKAGLEYIVITDHTKRLAMTHGLDEKRIVLQWKEIDRVQKKLGNKIKILKGSECDILKDGTLDLPDSILSKLDVVGVSVHSHFNLPRAEQTARVIRAISNPHADILFHPTSRIINRREPIDLDMDEVITMAKKTGTVLEINSFPERSDLKDEYIRKCVDRGVKLSIDSDAHSSAHFANLEYGIAQARRGWAGKKDIVNAWPVEKMTKFLKNN